MEDGRYVEGSVWFYAPNSGAPVFFAAAFLISGAVHTWQTIQYKCWRLTGLYVWIPILFVAGFVTRELGAFDNGNLVKYIVSICLVYAAPPLYELANYYVLGRVMYYVPYYAPIHPGRVLTTFAAISIVIEALNGNGAAFIANQSLSGERRNTGKALLKAALLLQIVVIALFAFLALFFQLKCRRNGIDSPKVNSTLNTLYISTGIMAIRTIYRIVEYFDLTGTDFWDPRFDPMGMSPIVRYEWFFYVFEASLMLLNSVLWNVRHPRRWLPKSTTVYLAADGIVEIMGPGYEQERNFIATLLDPFDIYGVVTGKGKKIRFWNNDGVGTLQANITKATARDNDLV
ncbi:RTA1 like protein-domain-containing protein [Truncatella angustata]|uniref:RTA1 like protein-domain-containing protein n=1 Tax=Truncatella angustata TaxID=152316 RepID=A0A9P8UH75_9PEZI|nr:RTA1 like protein-domain-containing protein [Truncatella angustata]KAH6652088.1 RTA1 like protein-domain-containing protein [Truncatella angustata]